MSELIFNEPTEKGFEDGFINGVTFLYACIQEPITKWESTELEYSVKVVVDEDTFDTWTDKFPKNGKVKIKTDNFKEKYGIDPVYPEAKNQYILTLKIAAEDQNGNLIPDDSFKRPNVYMPATGGKVKDVTKSTLVGNGSKGDLQFWIAHTGKGDFPKLQAVMVRELIAYEKATSSGGSAWGAVEGAPDSASPSGRSFENQAKEEAPAVGGPQTIETEAF